MAEKKLGELIREARAGAGLTQAQLAEQVAGVTAADISKAERGEKELTQAALKAIAKATGVTQASLLKAVSGAAASAKKPAASSAKKPAASAKKPAASSAKKPAASSAAKSSMQLTAAEKKLVELYRAADAERKKSALKVLKGETSESSEILSSILTSAISSFGKK